MAILNCAAFRMIGRTPALKVKPVKKAKVKKSLPASKALWKLSPEKRKAIADSLISEALGTLALFSAQGMAEYTNLTLTSVRNKLNKLKADGLVTKEKMDNGESGPDKFYFKLIQEV